MMQSTYTILNKVQTQLFTWGDPFDCNGSDVIICITGNPGVPDFYIEFGTELYKSTKLPVCVVGHAGHVEVPDSKSNKLDQNEELFNLQGQLAHKLDLISNYVDKTSKIHLVGHSIGAWLILELLDKHESICKRVSSINLLFPTIQKMAESQNGKFLNKILRKINVLILMLFSLVALLPLWLRLYVIGLYLKFNSLPPHYTDRIFKYLNPKVGEKVLFMAYDEMDMVTTLNTLALDKVKHLTNVIYSNKDGWAPVHYMDDLRTFQPDLQMKEVHINHAFVLKSSEQVAEMVSNFIKVKQNCSGRGFL